MLYGNDDDANAADAAVDKAAVRVSADSRLLCAACLTCNGTVFADKVSGLPKFFSSSSTN